MIKQKILDSLITNASYQTICNEIISMAKAQSSAYVCIANVHMLIEAVKNNDFNTLLNNADIATPDGKPLSILMNILYKTAQERIAGPDLMVSLFEQAVQEKVGIYFYGATENTLEKLNKKIKQEYPDLIISGSHCPPFRALSKEEDSAIIESINASNAGIVFVALGCPKQEKWMAEHKGKINSVMIGVGAAFNFYTGQVQRAPQWMQKSSLEWLFRLSQEPGRLFRRYFSTNFYFIYLATRQLCTNLVFKG